MVHMPDSAVELLRLKKVLPRMSDGTFWKVVVLSPASKWPF
jgi:hypothetical protein